MRPDHALLIGVDDYPHTPSSSSRRRLRGAVHDVTRIAAYLHEIGLTPDSIDRLTAPLPGNKSAGARPPTYQHMIRAFNRLQKRVKRGEQVLIHFSGHGSRTSTLVPEIKGKDGVDEVLVPFDSDKPGSRCLHDIELAYLIDLLVAAGAFVIVSLDCCYAGGALRLSGSVDTTVRGLGRIDRSSRTASALESLSDFRQRARIAAGQPRARSGLLPTPKDYVLLAACSAGQQARETRVDDHGIVGVFSHWLLETLKQRVPGMSYRRLFSRVLARVWSTFEDQTPEVEGAIDREIFGTGICPCTRTVNVLNVEEQGSRLLLATGAAEGIAPGVRLAVYPWASTDHPDKKRHFAEVVIARTDATISTADVVESDGLDRIEPGDQAVPLSLSSTERLEVTLDIAEPLPIEKICRTRAEGFVIVKQPTRATWRVTIDDGQFVIFPPCGEVATQSAQRIDLGCHAANHNCLVERLIHLARYRCLSRLRNNHPGALLDGKLEAFLELADERPTEAPTLEPGERCRLHVHNNSFQPLHFSVLNFRPDWSIRLIVPSPKTGRISSRLSAGAEWVGNLELWLPDRLLNGRDLLLVVATVQPHQLQGLQIGPLLRANLRTNLAAQANSLEDLLKEALCPPSLTRWVSRLHPSTHPERHWTVVSLEVCIKR